MWNHEQKEQKKNQKKDENPRFYGQNKLFWHLALLALGQIHSDDYMYKLLK
jgi:hypothetical protein